MKIWTPAHRALLEALRAERLIPPLIRRLSGERHEATPDQLTRLGDWPSEILVQPGWPIIEAALHEPSAWPAAWERAIEAGVTDVAAHHHALLFEAMCEQLLGEEEFERALWCWGQAIGAWRQVLSGAYMLDLIEDVAPTEEPSASDEANHEEMERTQQIRRALVEELLDETIARREKGLRRALGIEDAVASGITRDIDRRRARFHEQALGAVMALDDAAQAPVHAIARAKAHAGSALDQAAREAIERFEAHVEGLDLASGEASQILAPFRWIRDVSEVLGDRDTISIAVVVATVEACWRLRSLDRDEQSVFAQVLETSAPFNMDLRRRLERGTSFGHNSKCSDFIVFQGELVDDHAARRRLFERATVICPGHRNASMLLSYEHLQIANDALGRAALLPAGLRHVPGASDRGAALVREASQAISDARAVYPFNDKLDTYQQRLEKEAARWGIEIDHADQGASGDE